MTEVDPQTRGKRQVVLQVVRDAASLALKGVRHPLKAYDAVGDIGVAFGDMRNLDAVTRLTHSATDSESGPSPRRTSEEIREMREERAYWGGVIDGGT